MFLTLLFSARFIIEFWKEHQTLDGGASLNMGQWLSVPAVSYRVVFYCKSINKKVSRKRKNRIKMRYIIGLLSIAFLASCGNTASNEIVTQAIELSDKVCGGYGLRYSRA